METRELESAEMDTLWTRPPEGCWTAVSGQRRLRLRRWVSVRRLWNIANSISWHTHALPPPGNKREMGLVLRRKAVDKSEGRVIPSGVKTQAIRKRLRIY